MVNISSKQLASSFLSFGVLIGTWYVNIFSVLSFLTGKLSLLRSLEVLNPPLAPHLLQPRGSMKRPSLCHIKQPRSSVAQLVSASDC